MVDPVIARGAFALSGLLTALWFGVGDPHVLGLTAGGVSLAAALLDLVVAFRSGAPRRPALFSRAAGWVVLGGGLLSYPARSAEMLGRIGGIAVLVVTAVAVITPIVRRKGTSARYIGLLTAAGLVTGLLMLAWPTLAGRSVLAGVAVAWMAGAGLHTYALAQSRDRGGSRLARVAGAEVPATAPSHRDGTGTAATGIDGSGADGSGNGEPGNDDASGADEAEPDEPVLAALLQPTAGRTLLAWLRSRELTSEERERLDEELFYGGSTRRERTVRYFGLLALSTLIATLGVLTDSTAVVVGAMLIAPLMTPIMGVAEALASGRGVTATRSAALVIGGAAMSIAISAVLTRAVPAFTAIEGNAQIASRVNPTTLDLLIALASGVTGAFVLTREDISASLPGVAIAVALVPPLAVVGVTAQAGAWSDALGALLLFLTNLVSMVLAGGVTFVLTGAVPVHRLIGYRDQLRVYGVTVFTGLLILAVPLGVSGRQIATAATSHGAAQSAVEDWLEPYDAHLITFEVQGSTVSVLATGEEEPPPTGRVMADLGDIFGDEAQMELRWVPEIRQTIEVD